MRISRSQEMRMKQNLSLLFRNCESMDPTNNNEQYIQNGGQSYNQPRERFLQQGGNLNPNDANLLHKREKLIAQRMQILQQQQQYERRQTSDTGYSNQLVPNPSFHQPANTFPPPIVTIHHKGSYDSPGYHQMPPPDYQSCQKSVSSQAQAPRNEAAAPRYSHEGQVRFFHPNAQAPNFQQRVPPPYPNDYAMPQTRPGNYNATVIPTSRQQVTGNWPVPQQPYDLSVQSRLPMGPPPPSQVGPSFSSSHSWNATTTQSQIAAIKQATLSYPSQNSVNVPPGSVHRPGEAIVPSPAHQNQTGVNEVMRRNVSEQAATLNQAGSYNLSSCVAPNSIQNSVLASLLISSLNRSTKAKADSQSKSFCPNTANVKNQSSDAQKIQRNQPEAIGQSQEANISKDCQREISDAQPRSTLKVHKTVNSGLPVAQNQASSYNTYWSGTDNSVTSSQPNRLPSRYHGPTKADHRSNQQHKTSGTYPGVSTGQGHTVQQTYVSNCNVPVTASQPVNLNHASESRGSQPQEIDIDAFVDSLLHEYPDHFLDPDFVVKITNYAEKYQRKD